MRLNRILAVRNDRFGEFLLNIPAFRALKQSFPEAKLILAVNPYVRELAQSMDFVDEVIAWENKKHKICEIFKFAGELKNKKIDACVIFNPSREFNIIGFLAGIPLRIGYSRKWGFLLTRRIKDKKYLGDKHEIEYNLELTGLIAGQSEDKTLSLKIDVSLIADLLNDSGIKEGDKLLAVHPWTSDPLKQWPVNNFRRLSELLAQQPDTKIVVIGGNEETPESAEYFSNIGENVINLSGKTGLKELAVLLSKCKLLISGDSGPVHLACAVGTPVLALFRNDIPGKTAKRWGPWGKGNIVIEKKRLSEITVDEVFNQAKRFR